MGNYLCLHRRPALTAEFATRFYNTVLAFLSTITCVDVAGLHSDIQWRIYLPILKKSLQSALAG
jgi:hypothetical protein